MLAKHKKASLYIIGVSRGSVTYRSYDSATFFKAYVRYFFIKFSFFHQMIGLQKLLKMFFISSKKLFSFSRYSNFCNFSPSFPHFPDSKGEMKVE